MQLVRVVLAALLPLMLVALWQGWAALQDSRDLVAARLRANAWALAEQQRDPFVIAENTLNFAAAQDSVRNFGPDCRQTLVQALGGSDMIVNFIRTDRIGRVRCSVLPSPPLLDVSRDKWWLERGKKRSLYLASPQVGRVSGLPVHIVVLPLFNEDGAFEGTLSAGIGTAALEAAIRAQEARLPGAVALANARGEIIVASRRAQFAAFANVDRAQTEQQTARSKDERQWAYVSAPMFREQLQMIYSEPVDEVTKDALHRTWPSLALPLLAMVLSSLAIWIAAQRLILRWLEQLRMLTARFAAGDYRQERAQFLNAPLELHKFAEDLNDMAGRIDRKQFALRQAMDEGVKLTREINHRVKNNLQIMTSLLTLQTERAQEAQAAAALNQARIRVAALGLVHRLLYDAHEGESSVSADRLLGDLCAQLRTNFRNHTLVTLDCEADPIALDPDQVVPLTLFVVEAVTNAFRHAFDPAEAGSIKVMLTKDDGQAVLRVRDDGRGLNQTHPSAGIGIDLIEGFAEQVGGRFELRSDESGTQLSIAMPL